MKKRFPLLEPLQNLARLSEKALIFCDSLLTYVLSFRAALFAARNLQLVDGDSSLTLGMTAVAENQGFFAKIVEIWNRLLVGFFLCLLALPCKAAYDGFYIGLQGGGAQTHYKKLYIPMGVIPEKNEEERGIAGRVFWGYQWTPCWAAELGYNYINYASSDAKSSFGSSFTLFPITKNHETITDLLLRATLPLGCRAGIYAKAGAAYANIRMEHRTDEKRMCPAYGAGLLYDFCPKAPLELSWIRVQEGGKFGNTDIFTLGIAYHFG